MYFAASTPGARATEQVPPAWQEALDAGATDRERAGQLLMSMNAHINRDMPFLLAALGPERCPTAQPQARPRPRQPLLNPLYDDISRSSPPLRLADRRRRRARHR